MLNKLLAFVLLTSLGVNVYAAENPFEKNYKAQNTGNLASLEANPDTKMYVSNHKDKDNISMLESGYDMMGTTGFDAGEVSPELALQHGKAIKADAVLVYTKYGSAMTAASKVETYKEAAKKNGGVIDEKDLVEDDVQYKYYASYWAKLPSPLLGVHIIKLVKPSSDDENAKKDEVLGLKVLAVIKGSPAEVAGIKRGDLLLKINETELNKPEELSGIVRKLQGQKVAIVYEREGEKAIASAQVNQR
jgi:membrane-associated protease RseP (regulator of RpoE activity)